MVLMLFNPAKPLAGFFVNFCLCVAATIWRSGDLRATSMSAVLLYVSLALAYCSDETAWILYAAIPALFPSFISRRSWRFALCLLLTFPLFLAFVTWGAPAAIKYLWGYPHFDFWAWTFNLGRHAEPSEYSLFERISVPALVAGAGNMLQSQYGWPWSGAQIEALSTWVLGCIVLSAGLFCRRAQSLLLVRAAILFIVFSVYQGVVTLRGANEIGHVYLSSYYYDALSSNFSMLILAAAAACIGESPAARFACIFCALYIGYVSFSQSIMLDKSWIAAHDTIYAREIAKRFGQLTLGAPLTARKVADYWRAARSNHDVQGLTAAFAPKDAWLFEEMDAWRRRAKSELR